MTQYRDVGQYLNVHLANHIIVQILIITFEHAVDLHVAPISYRPT